MKQSNTMEVIAMESFGWRTVIINHHAKLSLSCSNLKITQDDHSDMIPLSQIKVIMINTDEASVTSALMSKLNSYNVKTIFCDEKHLPCCEVCGYSNNVKSAGNQLEQIMWSEEKKQEVWTKIVRLKIHLQYKVLMMNHIKNADILSNAASEVTLKNAVFQEASAARIYFSMLFGNNFSRRSPSDINSALNYGYSIILSSVSRSIVLHGYLTSLGINHHSQTNPFNLSCDIMEPFRPFVDNHVFRNPTKKLNWDYKKELIELSIFTVKYKNKKMELQTAVDLFVNDVLLELNGEKNKIGEIDFI